MDNYTINSHSLKSNSLCFLDNEPNWELTNPFIAINPNLLHNSNLDFQGFMGFSNDHFPTHQASQTADNPASEIVEPIVSYGDEYNGSHKRKSVDLEENSSLNSYSPMSNGGFRRKNSLGRGKRVKINEKEEEIKEVVHVRARRGQATDSHSIAERVRRGKINERLRCLQDIVPGCYKTMGMAVMLDEIINYVQSLQNQVEFLSMKLTAASQFHDFNTETHEVVDKMQKTRAYNSEQVQDVEMIIKNNRGYNQGLPTLPF